MKGNVMAEVKRYVTPVFRVSFPHLFEARQMTKTDKPKFGLTAVWRPGDFSAADKKRWKVILGALDAESRARFKTRFKDLPANYRKGLRDGAEKAELEGFGKGMVFASLTSQMRPGIVDLNRNAISPEEGNSDRIYPGSYCRATVNTYSYDNRGKGVALGLMNVQLVKDGERLDGRTDAAEDFEDDLDDRWLDEGEPEVEDEDPDGDDDLDDEIPF